MLNELLDRTWDNIIIDFAQVILDCNNKNNISIVEELLIYYTKINNNDTNSLLNVISKE